MWTLSRHQLNRSIMAFDWRHLLSEVNLFVATESLANCVFILFYGDIWIYFTCFITFIFAYPMSAFLFLLYSHLSSQLIDYKLTSIIHYSLGWNYDMIYIWNFEIQQNNRINFFYFFVLWIFHSAHICRISMLNFEFTLCIVF